MANETKIIDIKINFSEAVTSLKDVEEKLTSLKLKTLALKQAQLDNAKSTKEEKAAYAENAKQIKQNSIDTAILVEKKEGIKIRNQRFNRQLEGKGC